MAKAKQADLFSSSATLGFEDKLWHAAELMRGKLPATQYRQVLMGLLFLRYVSDAFEKRYNELKAEGFGDEEDRDAYLEENIFFVPKDARWERIAAVAHKPENGQTIDNAMREIEKENADLKGVLPKFYASTDINKEMLGNVIDLFTNDLQLGDVEQNRDLLGRTYEYCIQQFAEYEGKKGGEYYTPQCIVQTLVEVLRPEAGKRIYDPCCGSGGMFSQSLKFIKAHSGNRGNVSVFGQEANPDTWKMAKINMAIRGIGADFGMGHEDTLMHDLHAGTQMDYILANPPFNLKLWGADKVKDDPRWKYGLPPDGNANYAWIQHMISHLKPTGRIGLVLANGALTSATGGEDKIRQAIIEDDLVEGIVSLPPQLFYSVTIPVTLWFFNRAKEQTGKTLFINATDLGHMVDRTHRTFDDGDIAKIAGAFEKFRTGKFRKEEGFAAVATTKEIAEKKFKLTPGLYAGGKVQEADAEPFDAKMKRLGAELDQLFKESNRLEQLVRKNLAAIGKEVGCGQCPSIRNIRSAARPCSSWSTLPRRSNATRSSWRVPKAFACGRSTISARSAARQPSKATRSRKTRSPRSSPASAWRERSGKSTRSKARTTPIRRSKAIILIWPRTCSRRTAS